MEGSEDGAARSDGGRGLSRKTLLKRAGIIGVATAVPTGVMAREAATEPGGAEVAEREALEALSRSEADIVDAIVARLIPTDANGPGAAEARVGRYIDRALAGALSSDRPSYALNTIAVDRYAKARYGAPFTQLTAEQKDAILTNMEANTAPGFTPNSRTFFLLVRNHAIQGMFGDPYYGGNANAAGWKLIGFPGIKLDVPAGDQRADVVPRFGRESTYDYDLFKRKKEEKKKGRSTSGH
jgi:gluconate 2-dehydrogenase gamma chain